jgi:hypothetical protein
VSVFSKLGRKAKGAAFAVFGPIVAKEVHRSLSTGEYGRKEMELYNRFVAFMNGKKTLTGFALLALPAVTAALANAALEAGIDPLLVAKYAAYGSGAALTVIGVVHKIVKWFDDLTPDVK